MTTIGDLRPLRPGDRFRATAPLHLGGSRPWKGILEVASVENRGVVCDLIIRGVNKGHRSLYEWNEKWVLLEKI